MDAQRKSPGEPGPGKRWAGGYSTNPDSNPFAAAAKTLTREISIVMLAADRMAAGQSLAWSDFDRLHKSHQHIIQILADMTGREVTV